MNAIGIKVKRRYFC